MGLRNEKSPMPTDRLPQLQTCDVLEFLSTSGDQLLASIENTRKEDIVIGDGDHDSWRKFLRKLRRDGSDRAHCMLATLEIVLAAVQDQAASMPSESGEGSQERRKVFGSEWKKSCVLGIENSDVEDDGDENEDNWCLQEGWTLIQEWISYSECCSLYQRVADRMYLVTLPNALLHYARKTLFTLSLDEYCQATEILESMNLIRIQLKQQPRDGPNNDCSTIARDTDAVMNRLRVSHLLQEYVDSLPPLLVGVLLENPLSISLTHAANGQPLLSSLSSSCVPNAVLELQIPMNHSKKRENSTIYEQHQLECSLIALYDLEPDEPLRISTKCRIFTNSNHKNKCQCPRCTFERDGESFPDHLLTRKDEKVIRELNRLAHAYFQEGQYDEAKRLYRKCHDAYAKNISISNVAAKEDQKDRVSDKVGARHQPCVTDVDSSCKSKKYLRLAADSWHSIGAVLLTELKFVDAQLHWKSGDPLYEMHNDGIKIQLQKQVAYQYLQPLPTHHQITVTTPAELSNHQGETITKIAMLSRRDAFGDVDFESIVAGEASSLNSNNCIFVTKQPVVAPGMCGKLIRLAQEHVARVGWTTNRHYAVPTTDIPIHDVPPLLDWFQEWMKGVCHPLLQRQFKTRQRFYVHDAFLVRYESDTDDETGSTMELGTSEEGVDSNRSANVNRRRNGSNFLPLHYDESTHSFVVALNEDFQGGGTYFYRLDRTIIPSTTGSLVSFRGNQWLHGGSVVTSGVRYILAVFLYLDRDAVEQEHGEEGCEKGTSVRTGFKEGDSQVVFSKRQKTMSSSRTSQGFSFGFF